MINSRTVKHRCLRHSSISLLGTLIYSSATYSAPPIPFDTWTQTAGIVSATCPANHTCTDSVNDDGILQRLVKTDTGEEYIQFILYDENANGTVYKNENFINASTNTNGGIASKQSLTQTAPNDQLTSSAIINTGWANEPGVTPAIRLTQSQTMSFGTVGYSSNFSYEADDDAAGNRTGDYLEITQRLSGSGAITGPVTPGTDIQKFVSRRATGSRVPTAGQITLPGTGGFGGGGFGGGGGGAQSAQGGTENWQAGEDISITWIGQLCDACVGQGRQIARTNFSYQTFDNLVDANDPIATLSRAQTDPFTWVDPTLGTQPILD